MEGRRLDYYQPFLSTRRFTSAATLVPAENQKKADDLLPGLPPLPTCFPELKLGPIRSPGTIPFTWERSPGSPKDKHRLQNQIPKPPPVVPKPSSRHLHANQKSLNRTHKRSIYSQLQTLHNLTSSRNDPQKEEVTKGEGCKAETREVSSVPKGDEVYVDAQDPLNRTDSFFMNCSISGLSGLDGLDTRLSGKFLTDPEIQDFMMGRFLPAAQAMAAETPPRSTRKQLLKQEQPRNLEKPRALTKATNMVKQLPDLLYKPSVIYHDAPELLGVEGNDGKDDDNDDGNDESENSSVKACGFFARLFRKNSICLLNPMPNFEARGAGPVSPIHGKHDKSPYNAYGRDRTSERALNPVNNRSYRNQSQMASIQHHIFKLKNRPSQTKQDTCIRDSMKVDQLSQNRLFHGVGRIPRNIESSNMVVEEEGSIIGISWTNKNSVKKEFIPHEKTFSSFLDFVASENNIGDVGSVSTVEKTLYVDCVHTRSHSFFDTRDMTSCRGDESVAANKMNYEAERVHPIDPSAQEINHLNALDPRVMAGHESSESTASSLLFSCGNGKSDGESQSALRSSDQESSHDGCSDLLPVLPPLPKSPSESWLCRTLPSITSKNSPTHSLSQVRLA